MDKPRPPTQSFNAARLDMQLPDSLFAELEQTARLHKCSVFVLLLSAYQVLLGYFCGQTDLAVGTSSANRNRPELASMMGFFTNLLTFRTQLDWQCSFADFLINNRDHSGEVYNNQDVSFHKIVEALQLERDASRPPIFQANLVFQNSEQGIIDSTEKPDPPIHLKTLSLTPEPFGEDVAQYELSLHIMPQAEILSWVYNSDLLASGTVDTLASHFVFLLTQIIKTPEASLANLVALPQSKINQQLAFNSAAPLELAHAPVAGIGNRFGQWVKNQPQAPAVSDANNNQPWSYEVLDAKASQLARMLVAYGVESGQAVGLCLPEGREWLMGMLAIIKAGGCYVPLDMAAPDSRLDHIIADAGLSVLVCNDEALDKLPAFSTQFLSPINLDDEDSLEGVSDNHFCLDAHPLQAAYIIYTSGSTGAPKGVVVTHMAIMELVSESKYLTQDSSRHTAQMANPLFDAITFEVWAPLLNGGQVTVVNKQTLLSPEKLGNLIERNGINTVFLTTSVFNQFCLHHPKVLGKLDTLIFGGESVDVRRVTGLIKSGYKPKRLLQVYGPTETTTFSTWSEHSKVEPRAPIGRGLEGNYLFVLDDKLNSRPLGSVGELCIAGHSLARGYLGQAKMTAATFMPNPFATGQNCTGEIGSRLYRTGDLVRWNSYGELEYVGRRDNQIKVRGHRIELGEVESSLREIDGISHTHLSLHQTEDKKLMVAYYTGSQFAPIDLHLKIKEKLPEFMLPHAYCYLESLPLNANGKVEERELPALDATHLPVADTRFEAAKTTQEIALHQSFCEVLSVEKISVHDSFFDLGGDSVVAIQLKSSVQEKGWSFELEDLFKFKTVKMVASQLTPYVDAQLTAFEPFSLIEKREFDSLQRLQHNLEDAYPLSSLQHSMVFHAELDRQNDIYHEIITYCFKLPFNQAVLTDALAQMSRRHEILRTSFVFDCGDDKEQFRPLQLVHQKTDIPLYVTDLRSENEQQQLDHVLAFEKKEQHNLFDWSVAPLMRVFVFLLNDEQWVMSYSCHHTVWDGWSESVLTTELLDTYAALLNGTDITLSSKSVWYKDFIAAEQRAKADIEAHHFWRERLADQSWATLGLEGRTDQLDDHTLTEFVECKGVLDGLKNLAKTAGVSQKAVYLTLHLRALAEICGNDYVISGVVSNGRSEQTGGERCVGLFLNTLPLSCNLQPGNWISLVQQIHDLEQQAFKHRLYPLADMLQDSALSGLPFEVAFNYTHFRVYEQQRTTSDVIVARGGHGITSIPLVVNVSLSEGELNISLTYHPSRLNSERLRQFVAVYENIANKMAFDSRSLHHGQSFLAQKNLVLGYGEATADSPLLLSRIAQHVSQSPDSNAMVDGSTAITYGQLGILSDKVCMALAQQGVGAGDRVAVALPKSIAAVVSYLGVIKAGASYIPIDVNYPTSRIENICLLGKITGMVVEVKPHANKHVMIWDYDELIDHNVKPIKLASIHRQQNVYTIFTSGSTGEPKGVEVSHGGLATLIDWHIRHYEITANDCASLLSGTGFDAACWEIWPHLAAGAQLAVLPEITGMTDSELLESIESFEVSISYIPTTVAQRIASNTRWQQTQGLRWILTGGDRLSPLPQRDTKWRISNNYGLTETSVVATSSMHQDVDAASIGKAIANNKAYILGSRLQPFLPHFTGRLFISGQSLANGYFNEPALTAERFIPDPYSVVPGARMLDTGDLAKFNEEGELEYVGRADNQVQIRGHRIEPGEIEKLLIQLPMFEQVFVLPADDATTGQSYLTAYLLPARECTQDNIPQESKLRRYLSQWLPAYMLPRNLIVIESVPLTANGKLHVQALSILSQGLIEPENQEPQSLQEQQQLDVWHRAFGRNNFGVTDNFFALGGDSLLATRLTLAIRQWLESDYPEAMHNNELSIKTLYENPSVRELTVFLETGKLMSSDDKAKRLIYFNGNSTKAKIFGLPGAGGRSEVFSELAKILSLEFSFVGLQASGINPDERILEEYSQIVSDWLALVRHVQPKGPYRFVGHSMGCAFAHGVVAALESAGEPVVYTLFLDGGALTTQTDALAELNITATNDKEEERALALLEAQLKLSYRPEKALNCRVAYIYSSENSTTDESLKVWQSVSKASVITQEVNGDHLGMLANKGAHDVIKILRKMDVTSNTMLSNAEIDTSNAV